MSKMLVVFAAGGPAKIQDVEDSVEQLQHMVGGYFQELHTRVGLVLTNENSADLPLNLMATKMIGFPIYGNVLITGGADEDGNLVDYTGPQGGVGGPI